METNRFCQKIQNSEVPSHIYSHGGPQGVLQLKVDAGGWQIWFFQILHFWGLGTSNSSVLYPFFWILEPHSKFKRPKSTFSEIPRVQPLTPIIACRSAKMAAKHLRGFLSTRYALYLAHGTYWKSWKKSVPEKSKHGAASHLKGQTKLKWFFQAEVSSTKRMNEFYFTTMIPQVDLFSSIFWKKLKTPKKHFEINWPLQVWRKWQISFDMNLSSRTLILNEPNDYGFCCCFHAPQQSCITLQHRLSVPCLFRAFMVFL